MVLCAILLASCGFPSGKKTSDVPAKTIGNTASPAPLSVPPIAGDRPPDPNAPPGTLQPPRGINTATLFPPGLKDEGDRLDRLETAVQSLRNDFDTMAPAITRLSGIEGDLQDLITQLEALLEETEPAAVAPSAPLPPVAAVPEQPALPPAFAPQQPAAAATVPPVAPAAQQAAPASTPAPSGKGDRVSDIRIGEHPDKTRIVLDVNGNAVFTHDLDNLEKILVVELPGSQWSAPAQKSYGGSPLLLSHRTDTINNGAGTRLILQLKSPAAVVYSGLIAGKAPGEKRIVFDLKPDTSQTPTQ